MPNWCENTISINGAREVVEALHHAIETSDIGLMGLRPPTWDGSAVSNTDMWGTKWVADIYNMELFDGTLVIHCMTAWSPPCELLRYISENHDVTCEVTFDEGGCDFVGHAFYRDGHETISEGQLSVWFDDVDFSTYNWDDAGERTEKAREHHENIVNEIIREGIAVLFT